MKRIPLYFSGFLFAAAAIHRSTKHFFCLKGTHGNKDVLPTEWHPRLRREKLWDTYNIWADTLQLFYAFDSTLRKDNSHHLLWVQKNEKSFINS